MILSRGMPKKQKWMMKKTHKQDYEYWDYTTEMPVDTFLWEEVSKEEADAWYPELQEQLKKAKEIGGEKWYFIYSGQQCGLYKNYTSFIKARDEEYYNTGLSRKATRFNSLKEAQMWIQGSRDEEGEHWQWPNAMPIWLF